MSKRIPQEQPPTADGVAWKVFEHLAAAEIEDRATVETMTHQQRLILAINVLRQEVNSGGFDSYFRYSSGNTAPLAIEAAAIIGPQWVDLIENACRAAGTPYPLDIDRRELAVDRCNDENPRLLDDLDQRFYDLEADQPADDSLDAYVWSHRDSFFD